MMDKLNYMGAAGHSTHMIPEISLPHKRHSANHSHWEKRIKFQTKQLFTGKALALEAPNFYLKILIGFNREGDQARRTASRVYQGNVRH